MNSNLLTDDDDLDYYSLPEVKESEHYELGQCIRHKNPYNGEPEQMVLKVDVKDDYYLCQAIEEGGKAGVRSGINIKDAHYYYEKV